MAGFRLRRFTPFPPGGFPYEQNQGIHHKFKAEGYSIRQQAEKVLSFRTANGLPRATFEEVMEDIDRYQCLRLGNHDRWCVDETASTKPYTESQPAARRKQGGCGTCGSPAHS
jgi:hypothetical protein